MSRRRLFSNNEAIKYLFLLLTAIYIGLGIFGPVDPSALDKYHITLFQVRLLALTIILPITVIWLTALYGILRFRNYSKIIEKSKEGPAFKRISHGITILGFSLPITGIIGSVCGAFIIKNPHLINDVTIFRNYAYLLFTGAGLLVLSKGSAALIASLKRGLIKTWPNNTLIGIIVLSCIFTWLVTAQPYGVNQSGGYYLPDWLIILTLVIPYVYIWCRGILSAYKLFVYKQSIKGVIYKKSLDYLAKGIGAIIVLSVLTQLLTTLSVRIGNLKLTPILLIIYLLVFLNALGYGLVARGANKLRQIEEA